MEYIGRVYRPPSEAYSLIIQVTIGCTHNKCIFCGMYKGEQFRVRPFEDVEKDLTEMRARYRRINRIFLADGDALCLKTEKLLRILNLIKKLFPECERIGIYASARDINNKTPEELRVLRENGLGIAYIGAESGSDEILKYVKKGSTRKDIITAIRKVNDAGILSSVTFISGMGGRDKWRLHAEETAGMINEAEPDYASLLCLHFSGREPIIEDITSGKFAMLTPAEVLDETRVMIENIDVNKKCVFRSNHASNYLVLKGDLPRDKEAFLDQIDYAREHLSVLRTEEWRIFGLE